MDMDKIHLETVNNQGPPPDYASAVNYGPPPHGQGQYPPSQQAPVPYQAPGFQANTPAPTEWYRGSPGSGFHLLDNHEELIVERMVDLMEAVLAVNTSLLKRQFRVTTGDNRQLLFLEEDESLLSNFTQRAYNLTAKNSYGETKLCRSEAKIVDSKSETVGTLVQRFHCNAVRFALEDTDSRELMKISGGNACCSPASVYQLEVTGSDSRGTITKQGSPWGGALNKYRIKVPPNMDGKLKACCIAAVVHLDFRFHYIQQRTRND